MSLLGTLRVDLLDRAKAIEEIKRYAPIGRATFYDLLSLWRTSIGSLKLTALRTAIVLCVLMRAIYDLLKEIL